MTDVLVVLVTGLLVIAAATVVGPRLGVASPLVLVAVGVGASFLPMFATVNIEPEWILQGLLPPLLYSSAVSLPAMNFRRDFGAISGLSVVLVVGSSLALGALLMAVIPGIGFAWGVALGAIISPTDAVATSIVKRTPVSPRVIALLDGESLLNDATALVLLRTAIVAAAATFSFWGAVGAFAYSVAVAIGVGAVAGVANLLIRRRVTDPTVSTVISFTVPFAASVPTELLGASGFVAAVVAGLITGFRAPRDLSPRSRLSDSQNWRTIELVAEGVVFLTMGVQMKTVIAEVDGAHPGVGLAVLIALGALAATVVIRAAYVAPLLRSLSTYSRRIARIQPHIEHLRERMRTTEGKKTAFETMGARGRRIDERSVDRFAARVTRGLADIDYYLRAPLGWRDGTVVVWAGMRGAVTVAAAQTLPADTPQRSVLVLIAFAVAMLSLLVQGLTLGPLVRRILPTGDRAAAERQSEADRQRLRELIRRTAESVPRPDDDGVTPEDRLGSVRERRLTVLRAQRVALLDARDAGEFDADILQEALANLDASEIAWELRGRRADDPAVDRL